MCGSHSKINSAADTGAVLTRQTFIQTKQHHLLNSHSGSTAGFHRNLSQQAAGSFLFTGENVYRHTIEALATLVAISY